MEKGQWDTDDTECCFWSITKVFQLLEAGVMAGGRPEEPAGRDTEPGRTTRNSGNLEHNQRSVTPPPLRFLSSGARS
ncbi:unnamed protein product [Boreogadus saida]